MIDTHCHLYLDDFLEDRKQMFDRANDAGITKFYLPAIDKSTHAKMLELETEYKDVCRAMIGLHPCSVKENFEEELSVIRKLLEERKFAGIGETGLDFYWDKSFVKQQYESLERQAEWAIEFQTPLILHTRDAMDETIDTISKFKGRGLKGIFHCFGGDLDQANKIMDLGFYMGIGGVITYKKSGLSETIKDIPLEFLVLETDAPYLSPVPFRGKRNESSYLSFIAKQIAESKSIQVEEVDAVTTQNANSLFPY